MTGNHLLRQHFLLSWCCLPYLEKTISQMGRWSSYVSISGAYLQIWAIHICHPTLISGNENVGQQFWKFGSHQWGPWMIWCNAQLHSKIPTSQTVPSMLAPHPTPPLSLLSWDHHLPYLRWRETTKRRRSTPITRSPCICLWQIYPRNSTTLLSLGLLIESLMSQINPLHLYEPSLDWTL